VSTIVGKTASAGWAQANNILCVRLDNMGDVLMCTPAMRAIRQARSPRRLTLLASPGGAVAARFIPELHAVLAYAAPWVKGQAAGLADDAQALQMPLRLRGMGFDAAVIFTSFSQSALPAAMLCYQAGIPLRLAHCRENPYDMLTDWVRDPEPEQGIRHEVRRQLSLVASIGCRPDNEQLSFALRASDLAWMRERLRQAGIGGGRRWVLMHPGASAPSRRYPPAHWSRVIRTLAADHGVRALLTGEAHDAALVDSIIKAAGPAETGALSPLSMVGELDLGKLGAAIALAPVLVSNNTGPAHMAAALGTPLVDLYALTNPQHTPWKVESRVLFQDVPCRYCYKSVCPLGHHACLTGVEPASVVTAIRALLDGQAGRKAFSPSPAGGPGQTGDAAPLPGAPARTRPS
jgi:lipopolysaccharide heptosyltransferase II